MTLRPPADSDVATPARAVSEHAKFNSRPPKRGLASDSFGLAIEFGYRNIVRAGVGQDAAVRYLVCLRNSSTLT